jgi:hypothetical protein
LLAGSAAPLKAASPYAGNWKLILTTMPQGVDHAMFLVKIDVRGGKAKGLVLSTPVAKYENTVIDDVEMDEKKISFLLNTGDKPIPVTLFLPEGDEMPAQLLGSCEHERKQVFLRAERTKEFAIPRDKAEMPMIGVQDLRKAQKTGFSTEKEALLKEVIQKHGDLPVAYYARLELITALTAGGAAEADIRAEVEKAVKFAERYDPTMKPFVLTQALFAEVAGVKARVDILKKSGKVDEARAAEARLDRLEKLVVQEEIKATIPFKVQPFAGRKGKSDRVTVVELFTGSGCPPCVAAVTAFDAAFLAYKPSDVIFLQYHLHVPSPDPLTCKDAESRAQFYDVGGTPTVLLNGKSGPPLGGPKGQSYGAYAQLTQALAREVETQAGAVLSVTAQRQGDKIEMAAKYSDLKVANKDVKLKFVLVEELVRYQGLNGQRFYHQVVRGFPGGVAGKALTEVKGEETVTVSLAELTRELREFVEDWAKQRPFDEADRPLELKKLKVVALIQNDKTRDIYQAAQVDLGEGN